VGFLLLFDHVQIFYNRYSGSVVILGGLPFATSPLCIHLC